MIELIMKKTDDNPANSAGIISSIRTHDAEILRLFYLDERIWLPTQCDNSFDAESLDYDALAEYEGEERIFVVSEYEGKVVGLFMFEQSNPICYDIHSAILPKYWGKGISSHCGLAASWWIFHETDCEKITTSVPSYNHSAKRMAVNAGMTPEGINRASFMKDGVIYDQNLFGFTKGEALCP